MILVRHGRHASRKYAADRGKWRKMYYNKLHGGWLIGILFLSLVLAGCPKKAPQPIAGSGAGSGLSSSNVGESGVGEEERMQERVQGEEQAGGPLQDVFFGYDSFELSVETRQTLQENADWLQTNTGVKVEVEGHCDDRGTVEYNLALGAKRARAARDYLITLGVSPERFSTISYGEELPQCTDLNESCWRQNRRGHFLILNR